MTEAKPYISSGALHGQSRKTHTDTYVTLSSQTISLVIALETLLIYGAYQRLLRDVELVHDVHICMGVGLFVGSVPA